MTTFTSTDGVRLHYEVVGDGPPLVLHLGAGCDTNLWRAAGYVEELSRDYGCVLFDHRGHGQSDHPKGPDANHVDRYASDLIDLLAHLSHASASFFGWSNAVHVGIRAAEQQPQLFDALVLMGPIAPTPTVEELQASAKKRLQALEKKGWWFLIDAFVEQEKYPIPQWMIDRILATDIEPYIGWVECRPSWNWGAWETLSLIEAPTLMIVGELEDPDDLMAQAASLTPNALRIRVPEKEHLNAFWDSGFVLPAVIEFLAGSGRGRRGGTFREPPSTSTRS